MARTIFRLTDKFVRTVAKPGYHADGAGLYLQVSKSGTKSWVFRFTRAGRTRDMGLGALQAVNLQAARIRAAEARVAVEKGVDPIADRQKPVEEAPAAEVRRTFRDCAEAYIDDHTSDWRNPKHAAQWRSTLELYAYPVLGDMDIKAIDTPDVRRVLDPIWQAKRETARRVRGRIENILGAAAANGYRPATNPARWVGHLRAIMPRKGPPATPFAALPYRALPAFLEELRGREGVGSRCLEFVILTAARSGEARGARWAEIDEDARTWTVPAERMKANRAHVVPLADRVMRLLALVRPLRDLAGGFLFPGMKHGRPLSDMTLGKVLRATGQDEATVHGFRAAFKTWAEQETDHPNVVIESALAHIVGDKVEATYMRGDRLAKRRALMDDWSAFCSEPATSNVVPMMSAAE